MADGNQKKLPEVRAAALVLLDAQGHVLLAERPAHKELLPGWWEFPGGRIEPGEMPADCAIRETYEEVGVVALQVEPITFIAEQRLLGTPQEYYALVHHYLCREWEGEAYSREGQKLAWVEPSRLGEYQVLPGIEKVGEVLVQVLSASGPGTWQVEGLSESEKGKGKG